MVAVIGPNGAGKSTVVNLITGVLAPSTGRIAAGEATLSGLRPHQVARQSVARTFQNIRLLREASVLDNIVVGFHRHERGRAGSILGPLVGGVLLDSGMSLSDLFLCAAAPATATAGVVLVMHFAAPGGRLTRRSREIAA